MSEYGFTRFGTDKFITTKFFDPAGYENNRRTLKALYVENGSEESDYNAVDFEMYGTPIDKMAPLVAEIVGLLPVGVADVYNQIKSGKVDFLVKDKAKANYDANIATYLLLPQAVSHRLLRRVLPVRQPERRASLQSCQGQLLRLVLRQHEIPANRPEHELLTLQVKPSGTGSLGPFIEAFNRVEGGEADPLPFLASRVLPKAAKLLTRLCEKKNTGDGSPSPVFFLIRSK